MDKRTIVVIGTGAIGGYYGARLHHAGCQVHFLLHSDYEHIAQQGLKVDSPAGDFSISPQALNAHQNTTTMPEADIILVALKTTQNHILPQLLKPILKPNSVVILLQNGIGGEQLLAQKIDHDLIGGGLCFICSNKIGPGHIHHIDYGDITLGSLNAQCDEALNWLTVQWKNAGVGADFAGNITSARWKKLLWNVPFNGLSTVLNADTAEMMATPQIVALAKEVILEVIAAARAHGTKLDPALVETMIDNTAKMQPYLTSMLLDYRNHRPLEVDYMYKNMLDIAASLGVAMPRTQTLYQQLCFINNKISR